MGKYIEHYLKNRKEIRLIIFVLDIRHNPTENDILMYNYIVNTGFPCLIIGNKADKIAPTKIENTLVDLQNQLNPLKDLKFLPFSSEHKKYCENVWKIIKEAL